MCSCNHCFDRDRIVIAGDVKALHQDIASLWVDSISVESVHGQSRAREIRQELGTFEKAIELKLAFCIHLDLKVVEVALVSSSSVDVEIGRIHPFDSSYLEFDGVVNSHKMRATMVVLANVFTDPPHVSLAVNCAISLDFEVFTIIDRDEIVHLLLIIKRPQVVSFGSFKRAINRDGQVLDVISIHRHGVESHVGRDVDFPIAITCVVGS